MFTVGMAMFNNLYTRHHSREVIEIKLPKESAKLYINRLKLC